MALMGCLGCDGTYEIGLPQCPHCGTRSPMYETSEESGMPTITSGGASNAGEPVEAEAAEAVEVPEAAEPEAEQAPVAEVPAEPTTTIQWVGEPGPELTNLPEGDAASPTSVEPEPPAVEEPAAADAEPEAAPEEPEAEPQP